MSDLNVLNVFKGQYHTNNEKKMIITEISNHPRFNQIKMFDFMVYIHGDLFEKKTKRKKKQTNKVIKRVLPGKISSGIS